MKIVLQRVHSATVSVDGNIVGEIGKGYVAFFGVSKTDTKELAKKMCDKIARLRIFTDAQGKTNLSSKDVNGEILVVSQFTLLADCSQNRPSFSNAAPQELAKQVYEYFIECANEQFCRVASGQFAAHMVVESVGDGPFTLVLEA